VKALIDLDPLPYSYGGLTFEDGGILPDKLLRKMVDEKIQDIVEKAGADEWVGYLSDSPTNFRLDVATILPYKGNRSGSEKPPRYQMLRDYLMDNYPDQVFMVTGMEADDQLAIDQYNDYERSYASRVDHYESDPVSFSNNTKDYCNTIICTIDKDLEMVPGWHYRWSKGSSPEVGPWFQTEIGGLRCFYKQLLTGDTVDNIKGLHGVGKKSTLLSKIDDMDTEAEMFSHVYTEYYKRFGTYADQFMLENGRLLWMLREEGELWEFPVIIETEEEECF
jgi:hypothetical protein